MFLALDYQDHEQTRNYIKPSHLSLIGLPGPCSSQESKFTNKKWSFLNRNLIYFFHALT